MHAHLCATTEKVLSNLDPELYSGGHDGGDSAAIAMPPVCHVAAFDHAHEQHANLLL